MKKERYISVMMLVIIAILLQSYFQQMENFSKIIGSTIRFFIPLIWAMFLSVLLYPLQQYFQKKLHINKVLSLLLVLLLILVLIILFMLTVIPRVSHSIKELQQIYPYIMERTVSFLNHVIDTLHKKGLLLTEKKDIVKTISSFTEKNAEEIQKIGISIFLNIFVITFRIVNFLIGLFLACLILLKPEVFIKSIEDFIYFSVPKERRESTLQIVWKAKDVFLNYVVGRLLVSFVVAIIVFLILFFSKTPYPALTALMFGIGNMIPYLGVWAASLVSAFLVLIFAPYKIIYLGIAIFLSQALDGFVIGPKIVSDKVGLSSFWVVVSILLCGKLMGIAGMFLGVPIFCVIQLFYKEKLNRMREEDRKLEEKEEERQNEKKI